MNHSISIVHSKTRAALAAAALTLGFAGSAVAAETVSIGVGPVPLPNIAVNLCVAGICAQTPPLHSLTLDVTANVNGLLGVLPLIVPTTCPMGQIGAAVDVTATTGNTSVTVKLHGAIADALTIDKTVGPIAVRARETVHISACVL